MCPSSFVFLPLCNLSLLIYSWRIFHLFFSFKICISLCEHLDLRDKMALCFPQIWSNWTGNSAVIGAYVILLHFVSIDWAVSCKRIIIFALKQRMIESLKYDETICNAIALYTDPIFVCMRICRYCLCLCLDSKSRTHAFASIGESTANKHDTHTWTCFIRRHYMCNVACHRPKGNLIFFVFVLSFRFQAVLLAGEFNSPRFLILACSLRWSKSFWFDGNGLNLFHKSDA